MNANERESELVDDTRLFQKLVACGWLGRMDGPLSVLDCIGTGPLATSLIAAIGRAINLYGADVSPEMLRRARSRLPHSIGNAGLVLADVSSLPFGSARMDLVMAARVLEHVPAPAEALAEMARVARPGATLVLVTTRPYAPDLPFRVTFRYWPLRNDQVLQSMAGIGIRAICSVPLTGLARPFARAYVGINQC